MDAKYQNLSNRASERVRRVTALHKAKLRTKRGLHLAEGPQSVREVLRHSPQAVQGLYLTQAALMRYQADIVALAPDADRVWLVADEVMSAMSTDSQGILAVVDTSKISGFGNQLPENRDLQLVVCALGVQDPGNLGTIVRIADAAGADAVITTSGSVEVTNPKVVRASAGSVYHLPVISGQSDDEVLAFARDAKLQVLAADAAGAVVLGEEAHPWDSPTMWLLGNEARGFTDTQLAAADAIVAIPIFGEAESLNVAAAATLCVYTTALAQNRVAGNEGTGGNANIGGNER